MPLSASCLPDFVVNVLHARFRPRIDFRFAHTHPSIVVPDVQAELPPLIVAPKVSGESEELSVIVAEAHKKGPKVAAHAIGYQGIANSIHAGIDTIEH